MRLATSGTYWRPASHGCVGLQDAKGGGDTSTPGARFFNNSLLGDVVQVVNSPDKTVAPDNRPNGCGMSWSDWTSS